MNNFDYLLSNTEVHILNSKNDIHHFIWTISDKPQEYINLNADTAIHKIVGEIVQLPQTKRTQGKLREIIDTHIRDLSSLCNVHKSLRDFLSTKPNSSYDEIYEYTAPKIYESLVNAAVNHINENDMQQILSLTDLPVTIVFERFYCDKVHRDSYYNYFSRMFRNIERNCHRLSFFKGELSTDDFYDESQDDKLQDAFVGVVVLTPTFDIKNQTALGRAFFDPYKANIPNCYIRTTHFDFCILGRKYEIEAYPFIRQNTVSMSCAESTIWNILEYYGNRYSDYRRLLPSDIIHCLEEYDGERLIPSRGLYSTSIPAVLKRFGFEPKLYSKQRYNDKIKKYFHRYIESAVIVAVELEKKPTKTSKPESDDVTTVSKHSVVCIGHSEERLQLNLSGEDQAYIDELKKTHLFVIDSSHFYNKYVIIDDNQMPYVLNDYDAFSVNKDMVLSGFTAPIYKHVYLDAVDVELVVKTFLDSAGGASFIRNLFEHNNIKANSPTNPLVLRCFLTTSRNFKKNRFSISQKRNERFFYANIIYPKMIWVCELIDYSLYSHSKKQCVLGEIVIDSTAVKPELMNSILSLRICNFISFRTPNDTYDSIRRDFSGIQDGQFKEIQDYEFTFPYEMYSNNKLKTNLVTEKGGSQGNENT